jgi:hypothetical protein
MPRPQSCLSPNAHYVPSQSHHTHAAPPSTPSRLSHIYTSAPPQKRQTARHANILSPKHNNYYKLPKLYSPAARHSTAKKLLTPRPDAAQGATQHERFSLGRIPPLRIASQRLPYRRPPCRAKQRKPQRCTALPFRMHPPRTPVRRPHDASAAASSPASLFLGFRLGSLIVSTNILTTANTAMAEMKVTRRLRPYASITVVRVSGGAV